MKKAFTLVEILVVSTIVAILLVVAVPAYHAYADEAAQNVAYNAAGVALNSLKDYLITEGFIADTYTFNNKNEINNILGNKYKIIIDDNISGISGQIILDNSGGISGIATAVHIRKNISSIISF